MNLILNQKLIVHHPFSFFFHVYLKRENIFKAKSLTNKSLIALTRTSSLWMPVFQNSIAFVTQGFVGLTESTLLDKWRRVHAHHEWEVSGQYAPRTSCHVHCSSLVQPHRSRGFTVAQCLWHSPSGWLKERQDFVVLWESRGRPPYVVIVSLL